MHLKDGDRVVLIGDTFIERDQQYGYLETAITLAHPDKNITFRNLGWSGDTVRGLSRAGFDPPEAGFRELTKQLTAARPSVVIVGYGMADSFDGKEGLPRFTKGLEALLDLDLDHEGAGRAALADRPRRPGPALARPGRA